MVLVTGSTGVLGRVIALELIKRGYRVRACKRSTSDLSDVRRSYRFYTSDPDLYFDRIEWVDIDLTHYQSLDGVLDGITEVYHCAAKVSFAPEDRHEVLETGIAGTRNLLDACLKKQVRKFLFVSSAETIGINKDDVDLQIGSIMVKTANTHPMFFPNILLNGRYGRHTGKASTRSL